METRASYSAKAILDSVRELTSPYQPLLLDTTALSPVGSKAQKRRVDNIQAELRRLHEELNQALYTCKAGERPTIHAPADVYDLLAPFMVGLDHEELWVVLLNTRNYVTRLVKLYVGNVNSSMVRVAEVFQQAIIDKSPSIIVAHNHPSGDPAPSPDDTALTRSLVQAGKLLDVEVLDHIIVAVNGFVSLKERGLGFS